jgi:iron complex transport system substrate-binding protein
MRMNQQPQLCHSERSPSFDVAQDELREESHEHGALRVERDSSPPGEAVRNDRFAGRRLLILACSLALATPAPALRVISLAPSVTETVFALGAGNEVVGVSTYCDYPPEVTKITRVGSFLTPNIEEIIALKPDVIIGVPTPGNEEPVKTLQSLGFKIVIVPADTVEQTRTSITMIAHALSRDDDGRRLVERFDTRMTAVRQRLQGAPLRRVLMVVGQKPLVAVGSGTFQDELIRMARGINVAGATGLTWPHLNLETVIAWAPQVIIDTSMGTEENAQVLEFWKQFPSLPAVREQRLYTYASYQLLRPGPRIPEALDMIARAVHPERYE